MLCRCPQEFRRLNATLGDARDRADLFSGSSESAPLAVRRSLTAGAACNLTRVCARQSCITRCSAPLRRVQGQATGALLLRERGNLANSNAAVSL